MRLIGGVVDWEGAPTTGLPVLRRMARQVPDVDGPVCAVRSGLGVFASPGLHGPEADGHILTVADLDLTNLDELSMVAELERGQTALLAALYRLDGPDFVRRLRGGFAIALWDQRQRTLLLAVDHLGIKRLHYFRDGRRTAFASRPAALVGATDTRPAVDLTGVYDYLNFGYVPAAQPIWRGIHRLPPGHRLLLRAGETAVERYWDPSYPEGRPPEGAAATRLFDITEAAVRRALQGTESKEVGAFLSGGTDSSTVVGLMDRITGERVNAFSIGFEEERYNELGYAETSARHFAANHYTRIITPGEALAWLPRIVDAYDEPFGNNSAFGTLFCAQLARECGVECLLAGDGGDEIFGGNERYRTDRIFGRYHLLPAALRTRLVEPILALLPQASRLAERARRYVRRANLTNPRRFYSYEFFVAQQARSLLTEDFRTAVDLDAPYAVLEALYAEPRGATDLNRLLYLDLKLTIGDNDLLKVTRTAELAGLSVRFPLLDVPLVEFTGTLPARFKVRGLEKRYLFKRAFRSLLAPETLAKRKHGFGVPTGEWMKHHAGFRALVGDVFASARTRQRGYFEMDAVDGLLARHATEASPFYGDILWTLLMLELWHRRHADSAGAP